MKILKIFLFICSLLMVFSLNSHAWTLNQTLTGLNGQTIAAGNSAYADINLSVNGYHLLVVHISGTAFGANFGHAYVYVLTSVDGGTTVSDYSIIQRSISDNSSGASDVVFKISQYPYVRIKIENKSEANPDDSITIWAKYAIY